MSPQSRADAAVANTLVLYDTTGAYGFLGEQYAMMTAQPVVAVRHLHRPPRSGSYTAGLMNQYTAVVYLGSTYDEPLPVAFLDDVLAGTKPVMWLFNNIWQLTNRQFAKTGLYWANVTGLGLDRVRHLVDRRGRLQGPQPQPVLRRPVRGSWA